MKKKIILFLISVLIILVSIKYLPFGLMRYELPSNMKIKIPKFSLFDSEIYMYQADFNSFRSRYILKKEFDKTLKKYEKITCEGFTYYFDKESDITIMGYQITNKLLWNHITIMYRLGNYCEEKKPPLETDKYYQSLEMLPKDYSMEDAMKDNNFIVTPAKVYNENLYEEFMTKYHKKEQAFLRIVVTTVEGDIIIKDVYFDNKVTVITDDTRDSFVYNGSIKKEEYKKLGIKKIEGNEVLVAYNDDTMEEYNLLAIIN